MQTSTYISVNAPLSGTLSDGGSSSTLLPPGVLDGAATGWVLLRV